MRLKWITAPAFLAGLLTLATVDSQGQPPGFDRDRGRDGDRERGGRGGFGMDPNAMWDRFSRGQDSINLNDPQHAFMKRMMERRGEPMPPNGVLTRQQFVAGMQQRMAQGGMGGPGGGPGRFSPPGGAPNVMTFQTPPGPGGKPTFVMQGGSPGMTGMPGGMSNNPDEAIQNFFRMSDRNQDGKLDRNEARGGLRDRFEQYDANRDGAIDANEYRPYIQERMGSRGSSNSSDPRNGSMSFPSSRGGDQNNRSRKDGQEEEERPVVHRYGKLPKGLPSWWDELDTDQDGQVGLYEWRRNSKPTTEFVEMDLNADGYLIASEWLRHQQFAIERRASESASESGSVGFGGPVGRGGPGQGGGTRFQFQPGGPGGDRTRGQPGGERGGKERGDRPRPSKEEKRDEKKRNPFTGN
jgi:hypothetical protein